MAFFSGELSGDSWASETIENMAEAETRAAMVFIGDVLSKRACLGSSGTSHRTKVRYPTCRLRKMIFEAGMNFKNFLVLSICLWMATQLSSLAGTIPAGTTLMVKTLNTISTKDAVGKQFAAQLDQDIVVKGTVVARAGTKLIGKVETSTKVGSSPLTLNLTAIAVQGRTIPIKTTGAYKPESTARGRRRQVTSRDFILPVGAKMQFQLAQPVTI